MKAKKQNDWLYALAFIAIGVLFVWLKGGVVGVAMTVLGVALVAYGVLDLIKHLTVVGTIKAAVGVVILVCGWAFLSAALYILAAILLIYGLLELIAFFRTKRRSGFDILVGIAGPILCVAIAVCLILNQGGSIDNLFLISGILLIVQGVLSLVKNVR